MSLRTPFLAICCLISASVPLYGADTNDLTWVVNGDGISITITDCDEAATGALVIPETIEGKAVTSIGSYAFSGCTALTSIELSESVTSIGGYAFYGCTSLAGIELAGSVTSIGDGAFHGCSSLLVIDVRPGNLAYVSEAGVLFNGDKTTLIQCPGAKSGAYVIPDSVTSIGDWAFSGCSSLTSINIPEGVTSIGELAFYGCTALISITLPDSVTSIGDSAFYGCTNLTSITLPDGVTSIGGSAFSGCTSLTSATIGNSVASIGDWAFSGCTNLTSITLPDGVTSIGDYAFNSCSSLTSITIPDGVTSIGRYAFYCTSLTSIDTPDSVTSIGDGAFCCSSLLSINVSSGNSNYASEAGVLFNKNKTTLIQCPGMKSGAYMIPEGVTSIGDSAFRNCASLTGINIPESVISIGNSAFRYCTSLTSITLPESVISIGNSAFVYCSSLTSIELPNSVTSIGSYAFWECSSLVSINIPEGVTSIGSSAFYGCTSLVAIVVAPGNPAYSSEAGILFNKDKTTLIQCPAMKSGGYSIPGSVTSIGSRTFRNCSSLTSIVIPNNVTSIGAAFYGCTSLVAIEVAPGNPSFTSEEGVLFNKDKTILISTPGGKQGVYSVPEGVTTIGENAFRLCTSLASINIPDSVTSIGTHAFRDCTELRRVHFEGALPTFGTSVFSGADQSFITYPGSLTTVAGRPAYDSRHIPVTTLSQLTGGDVCVSFQAAGGQRYRVYKSPSIDAPFASWVQVGPEIIGADAPVQVDYTPQAGESSLFLRALVEFQ